MTEATEEKEKENIENQVEEELEAKVVEDTETEVVEEPEVVVSEIDQLKQELEEYKSKYLYAASELDNSAKRFEREKENLIKYGNEKVLSNLLEVVDNLERTVDAIKDDEDEKVQNLKKGVEMVLGQFINVLKSNGLEVIEALGKEFDPKFHEAMAQQPKEGAEDQEIINEFQKGYILNGRLLRASKVIVAKN